MIWELVFMLVILKIPVAYLCAVVWWAIRAEPRPFEGAVRLAPLDPDPSCSWTARRLSRGPRGRGPRTRRPALPPRRTALARLEARL